MSEAIRDDGEDVFGARRGSAAITWFDRRPRRSNQHCLYCGVFVATAPADFNDRRMSPLGFLAPDIQRAILEGRQPSSVTLNALLQAGGALSWEEQRRALGWSA